MITARAYLALVLSPAGFRSRVAAPLIAGLLGVVIVAIPSAMGFTPGVSDAVTLLRMAEALAALGAAFLLNNPAARTTAVVPLPRSVQNAAWLTQGVSVSAGWWIIALVVVRAQTGASIWRNVPVAGLTLEAVTLLTTAVAAAAWLRSFAQGRPGFVAGPALLALVAAMALAPRGANLFAGPGDPQWTAMHRTWGVLWAASLIILWLAGREPARRLLPVLHTRPRP